MNEGLGVLYAEQQQTQVFNSLNNYLVLLRNVICIFIYIDAVQLDLPKIIYGDEKYAIRYRIKCLIRSTYTETRLPPALNDILVTHPIPAAVSRFRLSTCHGNVAPSYSPVYKPKEIVSFNVWSSGMWYVAAFHCMWWI